MSLSDSPCISNAQNSVRPDQSRCIYHVLPGQQDVFHPTGHDLLNGIPLPGTENRHQVGPHVLRHMPYLPPRRERPSRLSQQLGITSSASRRRLQTSHETLPLDASPLVSRETSPGPEKRLPCRPRQSGGARCLNQTAVLHQQTALDPPRPKQRYLPRSSAVAVGRIPSGTMYSTGSRYRALGGGIKLLLTGYGVRPT